MEEAISSLFQRLNHHVISKQAKEFYEHYTMKWIVYIGNIYSDSKSDTILLLFQNRILNKHSILWQKEN